MKFRLIKNSKLQGVSNKMLSGRCIDEKSSTALTTLQRNLTAIKAYRLSTLSGVL